MAVTDRERPRPCAATLACSKVSPSAICGPSALICLGRMEPLHHLEELQKPLTEALIWPGHWQVATPGNSAHGRRSRKVFRQAAQGALRAAEEQGANHGALTDHAACRGQGTAARGLGIPHPRAVVILSLQRPVSVPVS